MDWKDILQKEQALHPDMEAADARKLFYQALRGGDHLLRDPGVFREDLAREWHALPDRQDPPPPLLQVICPRGRTARLHLVPARSRGIPLHALEALLLSCGLCDTPEEEVQSAFPDFLRDAEALGFLREDLLRSQPGPPHHSPGYGFAAYRVIRL